MHFTDQLFFWSNPKSSQLSLKSAVANAFEIFFTFSVQCNRGERWLGGEFISAERVVVWSDDGKAYLYKLPTNCIVESKAFHNRSKTEAGGGRSALLFCQLVMDKNRPQLQCPPAFKYLIFSSDGK